MKIVVCLKEVPDSEAHLVIRSDQKSIETENLVSKMNPFDECAIEEALKIKEKMGGEIILLTLGPDSTKQIIRKGLAMGTDRAIHLNDPAWRQSDALLTAEAFSKVIQPLGVDLIFTGVQSEDGLNMQTGILLAEFLHLTHASILTKLEILDGGKQARGTRELEGGLLEDIEFDLPAVITVQTGINIPRYPTLPGIMKARAKEIKNISVADLGYTPAQAGIAGSAVKMIKLVHPEIGKKAEIISGDEVQAAKSLVRKLKEEAKVL